MMKSRGLGWVAPLLVGASAAIAAEVAIGILLYTGPGLIRSLTAVLAVESAALGVGLRSPRAAKADMVERLRRRWLFCLGTFMAAAVFGTSWSVVQNVGGGRVGQGLGLAVLAALPLYGCGLVLGGMGAIAAGDASGRLRGPGPAAALGAGLGFVITGALLPRAPIPASLLVACLVLLSAGGMVYGAAVGSWPQVLVRASRRVTGGEVRVEDRRIEGIDSSARYLLEQEHVRRQSSLNGAQPVPWELAVARAMMPEREQPWRVLVLGGGASPLPRALLDEHPSVTIDVLERTRAVVELARDHFDTQLTPGAAGRVNVRVGNLEDLLSDAHGPYGLVLVDTSALVPMGGVSGLSRAARAALLAVVAEEGVLAWGPSGPEPSAAAAAGGWHQILLGRHGDGQNEVVVLSRAGSEPFPMPIGDFVPLNEGSPAT